MALNKPGSLDALLGEVILTRRLASTPDLLAAVLLSKVTSNSPPELLEVPFPEVVELDESIHAPPDF